MVRIREKRPKPGLRAQHLRAVTACAALSNGRVEGGEVGSREILYRPGPNIHSGMFRFDIGTAGSACMAAFTLIPVALHADGPCTISIRGGLFQDFAPGFFHMERVLLPILRYMGADVALKMIRPGYVPQGNGELVITVQPLKDSLKQFCRTEQGSVRDLQGVALASHLREQNVAPRMADRCRMLLQSRKVVPKIEVLEDSTAVQRGAALTLWASTTTGCIIGADRAGKVGRTSESIADFVVKSLLEDLEAGGTVDRHLADQVILFAALAEGRTRYRIPVVTEHVRANLWLVETMLRLRTRIEGNMLTIDGIGHKRVG